MSLLTPDSGLLFWMIVSFGIVFVILSKYGFPVIVKAIEQRKAYIDNSLETARQANERLAHIQAEGEKMLAEAKEKQNAVLKVASSICRCASETAFLRASSMIRSFSAKASFRTAFCFSLASARRC